MMRGKRGSMGAKTATEGLFLKWLDSAIALDPCPSLSGDGGDGGCGERGY